MRAALCAVLLALAVWPTAARADDVGPRRDIAAIRHDLPVLLAAGPYAAAPPQRFESVVVSGADAVAECYACSLTALLRLHYRYDRWWLLGYVAPSSSGMLTAGVPQALVALARSHVTMTQKTDAATPQPPCKTFSCYFVSGAIYDAGAPGQIPFNANVRGFTSEGYRPTLTFAPSDASTDAKLANVTGRAPTRAESWANPPSGNSYFFFSGTVQSPQPVHVQAGTTIDVWFPFVLDPTLRYSLTIAAPNAMSLGPIQGTLTDNTLHFVLPAFTAPPGAELMGEIEGN